MHLADLQSWNQSRILAAPALAAFGEPLLCDPFADPEVIKKLIGERLREKGVVIEIGDADAEAMGASDNRGKLAKATYEIFIGESVTVAHSPEKKMLCQAVADAIQDPTNSGPKEPAAEFEGYTSAKSEHGYVVHVLTFSKIIRF